MYSWKSIPTTFDTLERLKYGVITEDEEAVLAQPEPAFTIRYPFLKATYKVVKYVKTKYEQALFDKYRLDTAKHHSWFETISWDEAIECGLLMGPTPWRKRTFWKREFYLLKVLLNNKVFKRTVV